MPPKLNNCTPIPPDDPTLPGEICRRHWMTHDTKAKSGPDQAKIMSDARASLKLNDSKVWKLTVKGATLVGPGRDHSEQLLEYEPTGEMVDYSGLCECVSYRWSRRGPIRVFRPLDGGTHDRFQVIGKLPSGAKVVDRPKDSPKSKRRAT